MASRPRNNNNSNNSGGGGNSGMLPSDPVNITTTNVQTPPPPPTAATHQRTSRGRGAGGAATAAAAAGADRATPRSSTVNSTSSRGSNSTTTSRGGAAKTAGQQHQRGGRNHHHHHHHHYPNRYHNNPTNGGASGNGHYSANQYYSHHHHHHHPPPPPNFSDSDTTPASSAATSPSVASPASGGMRNAFQNHHHHHHHHHHHTQQQQQQQAQHQQAPCYNLRIPTREGDMWVMDYRNRPVLPDTAGNLQCFLNNVSPTVTLKNPGVPPEVVTGGGNAAAAAAMNFVHERYYHVSEMMLAFRVPFGVPIALQGGGVSLTETHKSTERELYYTPQLSGFRFELRQGDELLQKRFAADIAAAKEADGFVSDDEEEEEQDEEENDQEESSNGEVPTNGDESKRKKKRKKKNQQPQPVPHIIRFPHKENPYQFHSLMEWHETAKPEMRAPLVNQLEFLMKKPAFRMLDKVRNTDLTITSWFAVLWVPIHVKSHTPQNSAGSFLCFYLVNPPASMPGSTFQRTDANCFYFRGDYLSTAPNYLWDAPPSVRGIEAFSKPHGGAAAAAAASASTNSASNASNNSNNNLADINGSNNNLNSNPSTPIDPVDSTIAAAASQHLQQQQQPREIKMDTVQRMRVPIVGFIPARLAPDVWYRRYTHPGPQGFFFTSYAAPLFLIAAAMQLMQHAKESEMRRLLASGLDMSMANAKAVVLPDFDHLLRLETNLHEFSMQYTV